MLTIVIDVILGVIMLSMSLLLCPAEKMLTSAVCTFIAFCCLVIATIVTNHFATNNMLGFFAGCVAYIVTLACCWMVALVLEDVKSGYFRYLQKTYK